MIQIENLKKTYNKHSKSAQTVLDGVSLSLPDTGFVCILGESGCGKTTLMNVMGGLDCFEEGVVTVGSVTARKYGTAAMEAERNRQFGYVFQNYYMLSERSVTYNVFLGLHSLPLSRLEKLKRVKAALESVGMLAYAKKRVADLSGGQQQRVAIARALARQPKVIFADEPTGNLDEANTNQVCDLLRQIAGECLVVMVTHEKRIAYEYADRIISLEGGEICSDVENTPTAVVQKESVLPNQEKVEPVSAKNYWKFPVLWKEAMQLISTKGHKTGWLYACLIILTMVIVLTVGDFLTVVNISPEEFLTTDGRILEVQVERGGTGGEDMEQACKEFMEYLDGTGLEFSYLPTVNTRANYQHSSPFVQISSIKEKISGFSFLPLEYLEKDMLVYGRMPEKQEEVVLDRYVAHKLLQSNGILLGSIENESGLLGQTLTLDSKKITLTIVGICESENMTIYLDKFAYISIAVAGNYIMSLSELQSRFPEQYEDVVLGDREVLAGPNAGIDLQKAGGKTTLNNGWFCTIAGNASGIEASFVVRDDLYEAYVRDMIAGTKKMILYSEQKKEVKKLLEAGVPEELSNVIRLKVKDYHTEYMEEYQAAMLERVGVRTIVTVTILLVSAVMLLFLLKARIQERLEFFTVYRLLGVPKGKTRSILMLEGLALSVLASLPAALLTYGVITVLNILPSIDLGMVLPFWTVAAAYFGVLLLQMLGIVLTANGLLKLPPAQLAAKYDF